MEPGAEGQEGVAGEEDGTNCRDCKHWNLKETAAMNKQLAKAGFGFCNLGERHRFLVAGYHCRSWSQAPAPTVRARKAFLGDF